MVLREVAVGCGPGMPGPYRAVTGKQDIPAGWRAAYMRPLQMAGRSTARIVGGGVPDAPQRSSFSRVTCRAASPLAAVAVYGGGKCPGGMNPSPTDEPLTAV